MIMVKGENLTNFINKIQTNCDNCSDDQNYVGDFPTNIGTNSSNCTLIAQFNEKEIISKNSLEALGCSIEHAVKFHRANGGIGRGVISAKWSDQGLEVTFKFIKSPKELFQYIKEVA